MQDDTLCLRSLASTSDGFDSLVVPVHRASTIVFPTVQAYQERREAIYDGYSYGLYGTPTSRALERRIAALEHAERSIVLPSGFAAIALVTLASVEAGGNVLFPDNCYDTVRPFAARFLAGLGIEAIYYDPSNASAVADLINGKTGLVWVESPGSVTLEVQDVPAIVAVCSQRGVKVAADNAWATPLRFRPLDHGVDFSIYPISKYLSGHSDVVMGAVSVRDAALYRRLKDYSRYLGYGVSADDSSLVLRGIETLAIRLERCEASALDLARWLQDRPSVVELRHPALPGHPGHDIWCRDFSGGTGVFSLFLDPVVRPRLAAAVEGLEHFSIGASWGGTRSVVALMDQSPERQVTGRAHNGPIMRLSIGIEHVDDLRADLERAFDAIDAALTVSAA